jgi:calcineurin-like phosphoesterase family protein
MHTNMCRGVTRWDISTPHGLEAVRDFETLEEMNSALVNNINDNVGENDWLIHMGDWSFGGFERIEEFRSMINCKNIVLILGNHDHHIQANKGNVRKLFSHVSHYEELQVTHGKKDNKFVLFHYPILSWNGLYRGVFMTHGHQHLKGDKRISPGRRMDVGICGHPEFRPYHIDEVVKLLENRFRDPEVQQLTS